MGGRQRIRVAARALGIDVDEAHLGGAEGRNQLSLLVAAIGSQPLALGAPVHVFRLPGVNTAAGEAQGLEAHRVHGHRAGEDQQVGPGNLAAVFLLDRPEQAVRLVQVGVVRPTVERGEALQAAVRSAPAVDRPVGARAVPGHSNEERTVVTEVRGPPVPGGRHQLFELGLNRIQVQAFELFGIVEVLTEGTRSLGVPAQWIEVQAVRPPVLVVRCTAPSNREVRRRAQENPDRQHGNDGYCSLGHGDWLLRHGSHFKCDVSGDDWLAILPPFPSGPNMALVPLDIPFCVRATIGPGSSRGDRTG